MIKMFRGLKVNLIRKGRLSKYLLYALGEILLVVAGIIIAVQINNAIENDKRIKLEIETLQEIQANLRGDLAEIDEELENYSLMIYYDSVLIATTRQRVPFTDSIAAMAYTVEDNSHFNPTLSGFNLLQSKGIDLISNDSLRIELTDLYERWYSYYKKYEDERIQLVQTVIKPYMIKNFYLVDYDGLWTMRKRVPFNYLKLLDDPEWISVVQTNRGLAQVMGTNAKKLKQDIQSLYNHITYYLNKRHGIEQPRNS